MIDKNSKINPELLEFDFSKELNQEENEYLKQKLYDLFHGTKVKKECRRIISIMQKLDLDVQDNFMMSDFECHFNEKFKPNTK